jgi:hypothetical protein
MTLDLVSCWHEHYMLYRVEILHVVSYLVLIYLAWALDHL